MSNKRTGETKNVAKDIIQILVFLEVLKLIKNSGK